MPLSAPRLPNARRRHGASPSTRSRYWQRTASGPAFGHCPPLRACAKRLLVWPAGFAAPPARRMLSPGPPPQCPAGARPVAASISPGRCRKARPQRVATAAAPSQLRTTRRHTQRPKPALRAWRQPVPGRQRQPWEREAASAFPMYRAARVVRRESRPCQLWAVRSD